MGFLQLIIFHPDGFSGITSVVIVTVFTVHGGRPLKSNRIIVFIGLAGQDHVVQVTIERINGKMSAWHWRLFYGTKQDLRLAN